MPIETKLICKKKRSEKLENKLKKTEGMRNQKKKNSRPLKKENGKKLSKKRKTQRLLSLKYEYCGKAMETRMKKYTKFEEKEEWDYKYEKLKIVMLKSL